MMTIAEKILARASGRKKVSPNEYVIAKIDFAMTPGDLPRLYQMLAQAGISEKSFKLWDPEKYAAIIDHRVPPFSVTAAENDKRLRECARMLKTK